MAENGGPGGLFFGHPFPSPTPASGRFNLFIGFSAPSVQRASNANRCSRFRHPLSHSPLPPSSEGPILAPRAPSPKWTSLHLPCASWLAIYRSVLPTGLRPRLPTHRRPLSLGVYSLFSGTQASSHELTTIAALPCPSSSTLDRTRVP